MMIENYEEFSESQLKILNRYVTSTSSNIFALRNLPEVIKGALFSRYSRSILGLRSLLLKEFILNEETAFASIVGVSVSEDNQNVEDQIMSIRKAQNFYDRILDGYGDDSIGELGGAHLALENISMLAAKAVEDCRIGGSPLEKSTRYIYFDQKFDEEYLFYREPILMTSAYRDLYIKTCNHLFETYSKLIAPLTEVMEKKFPKDPATSSIAYAAAVRAKVLDCLRGLLPASALTNMGVYGNGRFFEGLLQKFNCSRLAELEDISKKSILELSKVIPSFIRRADPAHKYQKSFCDFVGQLEAELGTVARQHDTFLDRMKQPGVKLISYDPDSPYRVAAALLFSQTDAGLAELQEYCRKLSDEALGQILEIASQFRENRRHKSPRALEHATFTFEILSNFGIYRDLHRHRMLTQERQLLTCNFGYCVPEELEDTFMRSDYVKAMEIAKEAYETIAKEFPEEAQYIVPMAYNVHWYFNVNLRSLQWLCELRSSPAGHPGYREIAQELAKQVSTVFPQFERFFKYVDYDGYVLGRLGQEIKNDLKRQQLSEFS
ncbi:MAG: FAD-dependent thymidylate synthase [Rhabdochlamydiaceae bacterium]|nr:FAD-dependent thymidylate synthase [Rhabdochlamydiaceae bacterium]